MRKGQPSSRLLGWLTSPSQPAARALALTDLLGKRTNDSAVRATERQVSRRGWAARILRAQLRGGLWHNHELLTWPKYAATLWQYLVLADLGVTIRDPRMRKTTHLLIDHLSAKDGGFGSGGIAHFCVTGNLARAFVQVGMGSDDRVRMAIERIVRDQKEDGGWNCFPSRHGTLACWEGLSAFAVLPRERWTPSIRRSVEDGSEFYLRRRLMEEGRSRYRPWFRFHYPVHYYYDLLVGLDVMTALGFGADRRLDPALAMLEGKRRADGRWNLDAIHPDIEAADSYFFRPPFEPFPAIPVGLEEPGRASKLITLRALRVLKRVATQRGQAV